MITEDYCSYEVSKLLKEKGFDEPTISFFRDEKIVWQQARFPLTDISRPTHQMAMKWLREVHSCYIVTYWEFKNYDENGNPVFKDIIWSYNIAIPKYNSARRGDGDYFDIESEKEDYTTYEEVCEASIKYCLENLI